MEYTPPRRDQSDFHLNKGMALTGQNQEQIPMFFEKQFSGNARRLLKSAGKLVTRIRELTVSRSLQIAQPLHGA